jgi:hypothetical protein
VAHSAVAHLGSTIVTLALLSSPLRAETRRSVEIDATTDAGGSVGASDLEEPPERPPAAALDERVQAGRHWRLETARGVVHCWIPEDYDAATAATVVFVHGYWISVDAAWASYRLPEQFALAGINAMFIAPEAPSAKWDSIAWPSLADLIAAVGNSVDAAMPTQRLVVVGHSGAYRNIGAWLANPALDTVVLLDAAYTEFGLLPWVRASSNHRLVNIAYETGRFSDYLHWRLPSTRRITGLPAVALPDERILYVKTWVGHWSLVTDGVALPLALRALEVPMVVSAPVDLPLGLPALPAAEPDLDDPAPEPAFERRSREDEDDRRAREALDPVPSVDWLAPQPLAGWW